jgi:heptose I phosphotransferase
MKDYCTPIDRWETENLVFNSTYRWLLEKPQFHSFQSTWSCPDGETIKKIKDRSVIRISVEDTDGKRVFYLKKHNAEYLGPGKMLRSLFPAWGMSQGRKEFENICGFRKENLATVIPVAAGEKFFNIFRAESFLITEDFSPFVSLEDLLRDRPQFFMGPEGQTRKRYMIHQIAHFARQMHQAGFNHRDFNATHILLHYENKSEVPKIALFDLQRVDRRRFFRFRWIIKSLAEVNYTLPDELFNVKDRLFLFLSYKDKSTLHFLDRLQWIWIQRKTLRIKKHTEKILARRKERKRKGLMER